MPALSGALPSMRMMYCAGPGNILLEGDYAQQELRVLRAVGKDEVLGRNLDTGDVYTEDAKSVFNLPASMKRCKCYGQCLKPTEHVKPSARQTCKVVHLSGQYAAGVKTVFQTILEEDRKAKFAFCKAVYDGMWNKDKGTYKGTVAYWSREQDLVLGRSPIYSETRILGRRIYYPRPPELSRLVNYPIQGTAADMTTLAEIYLDDALERDRVLGGYMWQIMNQHDCLIVEVKDDPAVIKDAALLLGAALGQKFTVDGVEWTFPVDYKIGHVWGELKDFKLETLR